MLHTVTEKDLPVLLSALAHALSSQQCSPEPWDARDRADLVAVLHALAESAPQVDSSDDPLHESPAHHDTRAAELSWAVHRAVCGAAQTKHQAASVTDLSAPAARPVYVTPEGYQQGSERERSLFEPADDDLFRPVQGRSSESP